jgi:hypothetical protein
MRGRSTWSTYQASTWVSGSCSGGQPRVGQRFAALGVVFFDLAALLDDLDDAAGEADDGGGDLADGADRAEGLHADGEAGFDEEGLDVGVAGAGGDLEALHDVDEAVGEGAGEAVAGEDELAADARGGDAGVHEDLGSEVEILEAGAVEDPVGVGVGEQGVDGGDRF